MQRKFVPLAKCLVLVAALIGLMMPAQAPGTPFTIYGQVCDTDRRPVDGVIVTVTNLATGSSVTSEITAEGGWYVVNLSNLKPNEAHSEGDDIQLSADDGDGNTVTVVIPRDASSPQLANLLLETPWPTPGGYVPHGEVPLDSDGDGYYDSEELLAGTDPKDPTDYPPTSTKVPGFLAVTFILAILYGYLFLRKLHR